MATAKWPRSHLAAISISMQFFGRKCMHQLWRKTLLLSALALAATVNSYRSKRNGIRNNGAAGLLAFATLFLCLAVLPVHTTYGQTVVSGDVTGTVTDASGAAIPNV